MEDQNEEFSIEEFTSRCAKRFCPWCGEPIKESWTGRKKKFCSDRCRLTYWKHKYRHQNRGDRKRTPMN